MLDWNELFCLCGDVKLWMKDVSVLLVLFVKWYVFLVWIVCIVDVGELDVIG